ncbi:amino acid permease [Candidatus Erwinia haradaeae]|uniref:Aromatic amino acid transport protein AroP n=1 Tax=Candidatus Erwinia haradaeae TaxID=1922217 RepID=A0A451D2B7_9GAMM|nr:amino acid permease [Candidatus Erwinia haradaeae]VFP79772.1 Aromatic amino acid transport protein AroP [Candidatus Erwinia haradaeae]
MKKKQAILQRGLKSRHIQLISLGGVIGTGLFLGSAPVIQSSGPAIIIGYTIAGLVAFFIMRQIGEMAIEEPVAGTFSHFAYKYYGNFAGFISGWNYWSLYILVSMTELTAIGQYIQFWYKNIPIWISATICLLFISAVHLAHVRIFGEIEFWLSIIKIISGISMILFGLFLLLTHHAGPEASVKNLWQYDGFLPHGYSGLFMVMSMIMFSFGGLELIGITAAETDQPKVHISKSTNQLIFRVLFFYVASLMILLSLLPWTKITNSMSPFVYIFHTLGEKEVANVLNIIILTAALSVYNSCLYCNSRMLFGLAQQGNAPKLFLRISSHGVPTRSILFSSFFTLFCLFLNYFLPKTAFTLLISLTVSTLVLNWTMITLVHMRFRKKTKHIGKKSCFPVLFYPFSSWFCLLFMIFIVIQMTIQPHMVISIILIPIWVVILSICYWIKPLYVILYNHFIY